jgi:molybdate transport system substrate-binding protein
MHDTGLLWAMHKTFCLTSRAALLLLTSHLLSHSGNCAEIRIMSSGAYADALMRLAPEFERTMHHKVIVVTTSMGVGPKYIPNRVRAGEAVDVVILPDDALNQLIRDGHIASGSRLPLATSSIGMAVKSAAPKPDISSVNALKRTLLEAKSIAYSSQVSGQYLSNELFPRLAIADQIRSKTKRIERERVGAVVARGEAEIGFQQISELLPIPGIDYVGPLPAEVQRVTLFSAGVAMGSKNLDAARRFIRFLVSPDAAAPTKTSGLEPATPQ